MNSKDNILAHITIRNFRIDDYDALISLWEEADIPFKPKGRDSHERIAAEIDRGIAIFLVVELDDRIIGAVLGTHDGRKGWINRLVVSPAYRKHGVATLLVQKVEKLLSDQGIGIFACLIENWNTNSHQFFERLGYRSFKEITYYTKRTFEDI
ncbi:GNAT family N-acetyltransferase [candidate division CSSED10-310 bacterium]|uniref:GNAT family N-acetyltransferase n=1 Tax=candidate division CSSED10-310 bacterium TaxID=2855610 RepID=A0ABV6Z0C1_UNCC1